MARTRAATYDDQRALILARAADLFARRGYSATTMLDVAAASVVGKATLYHYVRDKRDLLFHIAREHVERLEALVAAVRRERLAPRDELAALIERFMAAYAGAQAQHRVLTEDIRFLQPAERAQVEAGQRRVVAAFARAIARVRPDLEPMATPLSMLLFGMINWTFTWLRPEGPLTHASLAPVVTQLYFGGLPAVQPARRAAKAGARRQNQVTIASTTR